jgi:hypothetical protein
VKLALDLGSDYLVVESELCRTCPSKAYKPGKSHTNVNLAKMWELSHDELDLQWKVIDFEDTICFEDSCMLSQNFYTAYEVSGTKIPHKDIDGFLGIGTKASDEKSIFKEAVRLGHLHRAMIALELKDDSG